jgi:hypothetical protein
MHLEWHMYPRALKEKGHPRPAATYNQFQKTYMRLQRNLHKGDLRVTIL